MSCSCDPGEKYRCFYCEQFIADQIKDYSIKLGLTMTMDDCVEVLYHMDEFEIADNITYRNFFLICDCFA